MSHSILQKLQKRKHLSINHKLLLCLLINLFLINLPLLSLFSFVQMVQTTEVPKKPQPSQNLRLIHVLQSSYVKNQSARKKLEFLVHIDSFNPLLLSKLIHNQNAKLLNPSVTKRKKKVSLLGHCRSTTARHAASPQQYQRHPNALRTNSNINYFQSNSKLLLSYVNITIVHICRHVSNTYQ